MSPRLALLGSFLLCAVLAGCEPQWYELARDRAPDGGSMRDSGQTETGAPVPGPPDTGTPDTGTPDATMPSDRDAGPFVPPARCGDLPCACDDGMDNDGDDLIDGFDPECTGALDQDEATFSTGTPVAPKPCRDCFWDDDMGSGNDNCRYAAACLRGAPLTGATGCASCQVTQECVDRCETRTPSGCDCFGCCEVFRPDGVKVLIELAEGCSLQRLDDPIACPRCVQSSQCRNECGRCELCPGRRVEDLPADCASSDASARCDPPRTVCSTSGDCTVDQYCQQGCCYTLLL